MQACPNYLLGSAGLYNDSRHAAETCDAVENLAMPFGEIRGIGDHGMTCPEIIAH
jgi:hypothetical protein